MDEYTASAVICQVKYCYSGNIGCISLTFTAKAGYFTMNWLSPASGIKTQDEVIGVHDPLSGETGYDIVMAKQACSLVLHCT